MGTMTEMITSLRKKLSGATDAIHDEISRLRSQIAASKKALYHAEHAPVPVAEIVADRIPRLVAAHGRYWLDQRGMSLVRGERSLGSPKPGEPTLPWTQNEPIPWGALCAANPQLATDLLRALVTQVSYEPGPATIERPALTESLMRGLMTLEAAEEALIDSAASSGVVIAHRPEVVQRRETERLRQEREAQAVAARKAREVALNASHAEEAGRGRAVPSPYLAGGGRRRVSSE
jgi:hypothetical protein